MPLHTSILPLVDRLAKGSKDGWLILSTADNQYAERSVLLGKRFGRLKNKMGHGPEQVFHSVRKTVATLLEEAGCPEGVAADVVGHKKTTMTYGIYSGGAGIKKLSEWIEKALSFPGIVIAPAKNTKEPPG